LGILVSSCATHISRVSPCITNPDGDYKDLVTLVGKAQCFSKNAFINQPITEAITQVPEAKEQPVVAVYKFQDLTGQRKSVDGYANFSTALTLAPDTYFIRALKQSGFFRVVERVGLDHLTRERQIIRSTREKFDDETEQLPLLFAGILFEGGVIDYNTNLITGGVGARYLGIGNSKQYREDTIVVSIRLVSVSTGEILLENLTTKTILSVGLSNDFFRYIAEGTKLVEFESGNAMNESKSIALQAAIETGIVDIINQGRLKGYWQYQGE
jgi:curli production assembly/transport component CsgG|tara:strand:- start:265 stop:1074 length:810 start_codon:yes stop_codon:yes gene_type:complete